MMAKVQSKTSSNGWAKLDAFVNDLDVTLHTLTKKAATASDESHLAIHLGLMELEDQWKKTQAKLEKDVDVLRRFEQSARASSDTAKVKMHLAKADVLDAAATTRKRMRNVERRLHSFKVKAESDASRVLKRLSDTFFSLSLRLDGPKAGSAAKKKVTLATPVKATRGARDSRAVRA